MATQYTAGLTAGQILTAATMNSIGAAWETYTPTWTSITLGNATQDFRYCRINKLVVVQGQLTFGSTTVMTAATPTFTFPFTASRASVLKVGDANLYDASADVGYLGVVLSISTTAGYLYCYNSSVNYLTTAAIQPTVPYTWAVSDRIAVNVVYEAA